MGDKEKKVKTEKQNSAEKKTKAEENKGIASEEKKEALTEKVSENPAEENKEVSTDTEVAEAKENIKAGKTDEPVSNSVQPDVEEIKAESTDKPVSDAEQSAAEDVKEENSDKSASDTTEPVACAEKPADEANQISEPKTKAETEETAAVAANVKEECSEVKENIQDYHEPEVKPLSVPSENIEKSKSENDPFEHTVSIVECFIITFITALLAMLASGLVLRTQFVNMEKRFEKMEESITVQQAQINALQDRIQELENEKAAAESSVDGWFEEFGNWIEQFGGSGQIIENPDKDTIANAENLTDRGYLGVSVSDSEKGVVVKELLIEPSEFKEGDIILSYGKDTETVQEILDLLETKKAGRTVKVVVERNNKKEEIKMTLLDKDSVQKKVDEKQMFDKDQESPKF